VAVERLETRITMLEQLISVSATVDFPGVSDSDVLLIIKSEATTLAKEHLANIINYVYHDYVNGAEALTLLGVLHASPL
jgi:hypothetical protein